MTTQHNRSVSTMFLLARNLALVSLLVPVCSMAQPGVPNITNPNETPFQRETHFLVFTGKDTAGENAKTANAYYDAIDPSKSKRNFTQWLKKAGFINDESQWHPTGPQKIACNLPGCDLPAGSYGDNVINTDSHAIVLNAADLGFVRNQFTRCVDPANPNSTSPCTAPNPKIYTYLENYPVNPFAASGNGGSGFPIKTGYPTPAEADLAIRSALKRPQGNLPGCVEANTNTVLGCSIQRIADVAFEWAPPPTNPSSSTRYGQVYAYVLNNDLTETIAVPADFPGVSKPTPNLATGGFNPPIKAGDPFPPNLDFLGFKQHPGVCFICHGGNPKNLTSTGAYPQQGNVDGFRFLPLDIRNLLFTSDSGSERPAYPDSVAFTSRANQELQMKAYNLAVQQTVTSQLQTDEQGVKRVPHLREVITGWYTDPGGPLFGRTTQNTKFFPVGWREPSHGGTAPPHSEHLYETVISPSCRSCHFNRELTLDFGTVGNFAAQAKNTSELTLLPLCQSNHPQPGKRPMPLAHLTYQRFWQANQTLQILPFPDSPPEQPQLQLLYTAENLANSLGFSGTAGYCALPH